MPKIKPKSFITNVKKQSLKTWNNRDFFGDITSINRACVVFLWFLFNFLAKSIIYVCKNEKTTKYKDMRNIDLKIMNKKRLFFLIWTEC